MELYRILSSVLIVWSGLQRGTTGHECGSSESVACREEFENLKKYKHRYQYASDNQTLTEMCRKQHLALNCVNSFAEECLPTEEQEVFKTLIKGSDQFFDYFCLVDSQLRKKYLQHSSCIRSISSQLDECTEEYESSQRRLDEHEGDSKTLKQRTCCLYFENIHCSTNATSGTCGEDAAELVQELWMLLGGTYLNELCAPYSEFDSQSCSPISRGVTVDTNILNILFPVLYSAISYLLK